jgi:hypothetical protein
LGITLLVKVTIVWFPAPPAKIWTFAVPVPRSESTSRLSFVGPTAAIEATLYPGRWTSVTVTVPGFSLIGRLQ